MIFAPKNLSTEVSSDDLSQMLIGVLVMELLMHIE